MAWVVSREQRYRSEGSSSCSRSLVARVYLFVLGVLKGCGIFGALRDIRSGTTNGNFKLQLPNAYLLCRAYILSNVFKRERCVCRIAVMTKLLRRTAIPRDAGCGECTLQARDEVGCTNNSGNIKTNAQRRKGDGDHLANVATIIALSALPYRAPGGT